MYCNRCGKRIPDDSLFCTACGARVSIDYKPDKNYIPQEMQESIGYIKRTNSKRPAIIIIAIAAAILVVCITSMFFAQLQDRQFDIDLEYAKIYKMLKDSDETNDAEALARYYDLSKSGKTPNLFSSKETKDQVKEIKEIISNGSNSIAISKEKQKAPSTNKGKNNEVNESIDNDKGDEIENSKKEERAISAAIDVYHDFGNVSHFTVKNSKVMEKDQYDRYVVYLEIINNTNNSGGISTSKYYVLVRLEGDSYYYDLSSAIVFAKDGDYSLLKKHNDWGKAP